MFMLKVLFIALIASACYIGTTMFLIEYASKSLMQFSKDYIKELNNSMFKDEEL